MAHYLSSSPITNIQTLSITENYRKVVNSDVYFFLVLSGEIQLQTEGSVYLLNGEDIFMAGVNEDFVASGYGNNLVLTIIMRSNFFVQGQSAYLGTFFCNSAEDSKRDYTPIRRILSQIALTHFEKKDINHIHQLELCYALLYHLNRYHYVSKQQATGNIADKYSKRQMQIMSYLEHNYMNSITLQDLSEVVFLTPTYLSRFFKKQIGTNFNECLNKIRLDHAIEDLLHTSLPITTISFNNGFSNNNALNILFKKKYGCTPSEYRKRYSKEKDRPAQKKSILINEKDYSIVEQKLNIYAESTTDDAACCPIKSEYIVNDVNKYQEKVPIWNSMINIGDSSNFNNFNTQAQLAMVQQEIGFRYGRIQGVLNEEFMPLLENDVFNFSHFDSFIELLLSINLTPFLDLTFKTNYLFLTGSKLVYPGYTKSQSFEPEAYYHKKVSALIRHCVNTFGLSTVEKWGFEIGYEHDEFLHLTETVSTFIRRFKYSYDKIKALMPNANVGGTCHNLTVDSSVFNEIANEMDRNHFSPDFISLCGFPYESFIDHQKEKKFVISSDPNFIVNKLDQIKDILSKYPKITQSIYLTVLGPDIKPRNHVNDSCFQSSFLVKNTIDLIGKVDVLGYWQLSDIGTEYIDTPRILFGGTGILSKNGLRKPGFTALKRLNVINNLIIQKGNGYLVSTNSINTYNAILCNYIHFNDFYCVSDASTANLSDVYSVFKNPAAVGVSLVLNNLTPGRYKVITTTLNREYGSLLDEWIRYGILDELQPRDIRYFHDVVQPQRLARFMTCNDGSLKLSFQLLPHEVKFLEVLREL